MAPPFGLPWFCPSRREAPECHFGEVCPGEAPLLRLGRAARATRSRSPRKVAHLAREGEMEGEAGQSPRVQHGVFAFPHRPPPPPRGRPVTETLSPPRVKSAGTLPQLPGLISDLGKAPPRPLTVIAACLPAPASSLSLSLPSSQLLAGSLLLAPERAQLRVFQASCPGEPSVHSPRTVCWRRRRAGGGASPVPEPPPPGRSEGAARAEK